ncbi:MAG: prephenate dehydrogenase/arogenate dehydrogenase family protein [Candidatus Omnitrophica bacterium]|nr:prephenate dehydrogenase/arogenate dehydrogenase family protein [Candidatus Omnitrophota bacterium]MDD5027264.1 prephenate dehydrogenase/arogenate dehydrogenase family protein [Candidatus Omnitrophota bacterium]MDD5661859.1 prephenate dehydrogenase/arogenate dehydrogenase family protein [Candidatus Omnitrophota bacterium]
MLLFNKVAVIGTGLIGGSLALVIKKEKLAKEIVGVARHQASLDLALKSKAIDRGALSFNIIKGADLLILAAPVDTIISLREEILKYVNNDCIVTDVGSTKEKIVSFLGKDFLNYVGSHPLAGSEKRGVIYAQAGIFKGTLCILTPTLKTPGTAMKKIKALWQKAGARVICLSPKEHDRVLSFTSHLPHAVAFSLIDSIPDASLKFSASGLKDTTRIAASDALLWQGIFLTNRKNILKAIADFEKKLLKIKSAISKNNKKELRAILARAQKKRNSLG